MNVILLTFLGRSNVRETRRICFIRLSASSREGSTQSDVCVTNFTSSSKDANAGRMATLCEAEGTAEERRAVRTDHLGVAGAWPDCVVWLLGWNHHQRKHFHRPCKTDSKICIGCPVSKRHCCIPGGEKLQITMNNSAITVISYRFSRLLLMTTWISSPGYIIDYKNQRF